MDNQPLFPDVYAEAEIWFHGRDELFRRPVRTTQSGEKPMNSVTFN
jgi:hypothetical protein